MTPRRAKPQHKGTKRAAAATRHSARNNTTSTTQPTPDMNPPSSPVYFWRESEPFAGYLSQWYPCAFTDDTDPSIIYPTAEHYMMYHKAQLFHDEAIAAAILATPHPRDVKALGRQVAGFSDAVWNARREAVVRRGNLLKFTRPADAGDGFWLVASGNAGAAAAGADEGGQKDEERKGEGQTEEGVVSIREMLLRTGERDLVEASPMDRIWGIGFGAARAGTVDRKRWGLNLLGKALMDVRAELRGEDGGGAAAGAKGSEKVEEKVEAVKR